MRHRSYVFFMLFFSMLFSIVPTAMAWEHHPLLTAPVISTMPEITSAGSAVATSLETFLVATETDLVTLLADEETWARDNMPSYKPRPDALAFQATGNANDIRERFFKAIRVNPTIKTPLYISPLANTTKSAKTVLASSDVSILQDTSNLSVFRFEGLNSGESVSPADIVAAASNEPDYGLDIGLFEDNNTDFGQNYGFGVQPFGNPGLDFGSQAPFHMGFYHESGIIYLFASFLKESYPEYRIHLFKSLSEFAFEHGNDYWGWRFMGWGMHYLCDLSMPYHTTALPGVSTMRMLLINLLDMIGWSTPKDNAVQLSSNRHVALETFEGILMVDATAAQNTQDVTMAALLQDRTIPAYSDSVPRDRISNVSHDLNGKMDKALKKYMPSEFVNDPSVELGDVPERYQIIDMIEAEHGADAVAKIEQLQAQTLVPFAVYGRSYATAILNPAKQVEAARDEVSPLLSFCSTLLRGMEAMTAE